MKVDRLRGLSLLELLIVVGVLGVLLAVSSLVLPRDRIAVNQAVERFERDIQRARFNAISHNTALVFTVDADSDVYRAVPDPMVDGTRRAGFTVDLASEGLRGVGIELPSGGAGVCSDARATINFAAWQFDARGVGRQDGVTLVRFVHASGFGVLLCVNSYGRVQRL